jgi:predicted Zn-dependent protease
MITKKLATLIFGAAVLASTVTAAANAAHVTRSRSVTPLFTVSPAYYAGSQLMSGSGVSTHAVRGRGHASGSHPTHRNHVASVRGGAGGGGDYLSQVGGDTRWPGGKTIRVYVAPTGRAQYKNMVAGALNQWSNAAGHAFTWELVGSPGSADYTISWTGTQREVSTGTEAGLTTTDTAENGYGGETIEHAHTRILTRYEGHQLSDRDVAETILHEIGHGLGLEGHSSNPRDIMYYAAVQGQGGLTARDMNTIAKLYQQ